MNKKNNIGKQSTGKLNVLLSSLLCATLVMAMSNFAAVEQVAFAQNTADATAADLAQEAVVGSANGAPVSAKNTTSVMGVTKQTAAKDEVVYVNLSGDGSVEQSFVVNHFKLKSAGTIEDYGSYDAVQNITSTAELVQSNGLVSFAAEEGDFYYQGSISNSKLPWNISIQYKLDGKNISAKDLAGMSGKLQIDISTSANKVVDPLFYEHYLLQISLSLAADKTANLVADGATIASAGKNKQVAFMVMPNKGGNLRLSADVTDFEMSGMQISAVPFTMAFDVPDTSDVSADMRDLSDAIAALNDGVLELKDGMAALSEGSAALESGSSELQAALDSLSTGASQLDGAADEIEKALSEISAQLNSGMIDTEQLTELIEGLRTMSAALSGSEVALGLAEGLMLIKLGLSGAITQFDTYMADVSVLGEADILALMSDPGFFGLRPSSQQTISSLVDLNVAVSYVLGAWYGSEEQAGIKAGLEQASNGLDEPIKACQTMAGQLDLVANGLEGALDSLDDLSLLAGYITQLSGEFKTFSDGLHTYSLGADAVSVSYATFDSGLKSYLSGTDGLYGGIVELSHGTDELHINTADLPEVMQAEIDAFMADYKAADFELQSFVSKRNTNVQSVQFVMLSEAIEKPEPIKEPQVEEDDGGFWGRVLSLFGL